MCLWSPVCAGAHCGAGEQTDRQTHTAKVRLRQDERAPRLNLLPAGGWANGKAFAGRAGPSRSWAGCRAGGERAGAFGAGSLSSEGTLRTLGQARTPTGLSPRGRDASGARSSVTRAASQRPRRRVPDLSTWAQKVPEMGRSRRAAPPVPCRLCWARARICTWLLSWGHRRPEIRQLPSSS